MLWAEKDDAHLPAAEIYPGGRSVGGSIVKAADVADGGGHFLGPSAFNAKPYFSLSMKNCPTTILLKSISFLFAMPYQSSIV